MNTLLNHRSQVPCYAYFQIFIFHSSAIGLDNDSSKSPVFAASRYNFDLSEADVLLRHPHVWKELQTRVTDERMDFLNLWGLYYADT